MTDKKIEAIKAQIKTELDSMILKEFGDDSRLDGLSDDEKIMAVDYLKEEDYESLQSLNELKSDMLVVGENKNEKSKQLGSVFLAVKKQGKFYYWANSYHGNRELMSSEKITLAEISLDDFFEARLYSSSKKIEAFVSLCESFANEATQKSAGASKKAPAVKAPRLLANVRKKRSNRVRVVKIFNGLFYETRRR